MSNIVTLVLTIVLTTINIVHVYGIKCEYCKINSPQTIVNENIFLGPSCTEIEKAIGAVCKIKVVDKNTFKGMENIIKIHLNDNEIYELDKTTFHATWALEELYLQNNKISHLENTLFSNLTALNTLNLNNNNISALSPTLFEHLWNLELLFLDVNEIEEINNHLFENNTKLNTIHLSNNKIRNVKKGTFDKNTAIINLHLFANEITSIETGIFANLIKLENITLHENKIQNISNHAFAKKSILTYISVSRNNLEYLNATFFAGLTNLTLLLDGNPWNCDCKLLELIILSQRPGKQDNKSNCEKPLKLQNKLFNEINVINDFPCCNNMSLKKIHRIDEDITLDCQMCTEIDANINWLHNGGIMEDDKKYKITKQTLDNGFVSTNLTISCADKNDSGTYICRATNANKMNLQEKEYDILLTNQNNCGSLFSSCFIISIACVVLVTVIVILIACSMKHVSETLQKSQTDPETEGTELEVLNTPPSN